MLLFEPAFAALRRAHDATVHGVRRYRRAELAALAERAGLRVQRSTYVYSFLAPAAAGLALADRVHPPRDPGGTSDVERSALDRLFGPLSVLERKWLRGHRVEGSELCAAALAVAEAAPPGDQDTLEDRGMAYTMGAMLAIDGSQDTARALAWFGAAVALVRDVDRPRSPLLRMVDPLYTMFQAYESGHLDPGRAARAAAILEPRIAVPIHWGTLFPIGLSRLGRRHLIAPPREFESRCAELAPQIDVRVLSPGEATSLSA